MRRGAIPLLLLGLAVGSFAQKGTPLGESAQQHFVALLRLDTSSPPGNETRVAEYLKRVAEQHGITAELLGPDPARLNFIARLKGSGDAPPLMLMAHSDVVPADRTQWTVDPFSAEIRDGEVYGRGAQDCKSLLAAELAVLIELKQRGIKLRRDVILLSEADEESGSTGIQWLIANAWEKIRAEAALNEGGVLQDVDSGTRLFQIQTTEKIPTRVVLRARGTAGHGSLPRNDNAVVHLAQAITRLGGHQPVRLNATTRRYLTALAGLPDYTWFAPLLATVQLPEHEAEDSEAIRLRDPELDAQLHTTITPTMLHAGMKINVIPNSAEAQVDVRRLPDETAEEVLDRIRRMINDPAVEVSPADGQTMPATEPSATGAPVYLAMERVFRAAHTQALVVPYMLRGATDGSYLRQKGVAVYGVPLFLKEGSDSRAHGNDERMSVSNLRAGTELLWKIVLEAAAEGN